MRLLLILDLLFLILVPASLASPPSGGSGTEMHLILRQRIQTHGASDTWSEARFEQTLAPVRTAIVITDMWDKHWCRGATERVGQIAQRMEPLLERARASGILIIHAPSETMDFYAGSEGRRLAQTAPEVDPPEAAPLHDPPLPIDDSNGGCDTPGDSEHRAWSREIPLLTIARGDVISDSGTEYITSSDSTVLIPSSTWGCTPTCASSIAALAFAKWRDGGFIASWFAISQTPCMSLRPVHLCRMQPARNS